MKNSIGNSIRLLSVILVIVVVAACSNNNDNNDNTMSTADKLVGTWTTSVTNIDASVGTQSLTDYLVNDVGLSATDAATQFGLFVASLESEVTGSLTLNADNTYESNFGSGTGNGTWSLSADEKTLTLLEGSDTILISIISISGNTLNASIGDTIPVDLDNDPGTADVDVTVEATLTLTK